MFTLLGTRGLFALHGDSGISVSGIPSRDMEEEGWLSGQIRAVFHVADVPIVSLMSLGASRPGCRYGTSNGDQDMIPWRVSRKAASC